MSNKVCPFISVSNEIQLKQLNFLSIKPLLYVQEVMSISCAGNSVLNEISSKTAQFVKIAETLIQYKADVNR